MRYLLMSGMILMLQGAAYAQGSGERSGRLDFSKGETSTVSAPDRARPDIGSGDRSRSEGSRSSGNQISPETPVQAQLRELNRLLGLLNDPTYAAFLGNNPGLADQYFKEVEAARFQLRELQAQERAAAAARAEAVRAEQARAEQVRRAEQARGTRASDKFDHH